MSEEVGAVGVQEPVSELEAKLKTDYEQKFEIWKTKELSDLKEAQEGEIQEAVKKLFEKWQTEQKPPSLDEIKTLLEQEYSEVKIKIPVYDDNDEKKELTFVIRELPQTIERRFYRQFKDRVKEKGPQLGAFVQRNMDTSFEQQVTAFLDTFDGAFDILADAVVMILNPRGKREEINAEWVTNNISSNRMYSIILAQVEVNRLRDFFSRVFQSGQKAQTMMTPLNFQQLRQLVR